MESTKSNGSGVGTLGKYTKKEFLILSALVDCQYVTSLTANIIAQTVCGNKYISILRGKGIPIRDAWQRSANGANFKVYWIDPEYIKKIVA